MQLHKHDFYPVSKRFLDFVLGLSILLTVWPAMFLIAVAIKLSSPGPIFFVQRRTGLRGRPFYVVKFRTMAPHTKAVIGFETSATDARITRLGRILRSSGLDELPQLFNVLMGEMSLVGPRPLLQWENDQCNERQKRRLLVKPGITGLSQVNGRNRIPWDERIEWDVRYVEYSNLWLDTRIALKTLAIVFFGRDAYISPWQKRDGA